MLPYTSWRRIFPVAVLLIATTVFLRVRQGNETLPVHKDLSSFPSQIGRWESTNLTLAADELAVLGPGQFLLRDYRHGSSDPALNLFIAYFPSQRAGDTIHSPKNCIPGSGWAPLEAGIIPIHRSDGSVIRINRYLVSREADRDLVYYWYQAHGRVTPSEYWAKIYLVSDAMYMNRTDGALVRVVAPIAHGAEQDAKDQALSFIQQILPLLDGYIPQ